MIPKKFMETFLQKRRFNKIIPYIIGESILDYGGNNGELGLYLKNRKYDFCNEEYEEVIKGKKYDTIVMLAVIEHLHVWKAFVVMKDLYKHLKPNGRIIITTPTKYAIPILEVMSILGITDRQNILQHKHYWNCPDLANLMYNLKHISIVKYKVFQLGMNQIIIFEKNPTKKDKCKRCHRELQDPDSIKYGYGKICLEHEEKMKNQKKLGEFDGSIGTQSN